MTCRNCGGAGGKKGNKHVRGRSFTCTRWSNSGDRMPDVAIGSLSDWSPSDDSTGYTSGNYYSCGGGVSE